MAVKRAKSARSERRKLILIGILAVCLGAILLWPEGTEEAPLEASGQAPRARSASHASRPPQPAQAGQPIHTPGAADSPDKGGSLVRTVRPKLPRIDSQIIAAADPFTPLSQLSAGSTDSEQQPAEALAAAAARASVRAVYRTSRGAAAIVDDQIIPVKDAKHWIATLRAAE